MIKRCLCVWGFCLLLMGAPVVAEETASQQTPPKVKWSEVSLATGKVTLQLPDTWKPQKLRSRILEKEFEVAAAKGDQVGRLTMMRSGGSIEQNVERWYGQFKQPDNKPTKDVAKVEKKKINGQSVVLVDIKGTYMERSGGGPFAGGKLVPNPGYRMLAGIVQTKTKPAMQYFFKLYGPEKTVAAAAPHFRKMMESVKSK